MVTIFIGSNDRISHVLNLTVRNDTNIFRKVNWTKRTEVSAKDLTCFIFCSWFKEISSKVVFQLHIVNLIITDKKGHHWFIISNEKQSLDGLFFWNIQESSNAFFLRLGKQPDDGDEKGERQQDGHVRCPGCCSRSPRT